MAIKEIMSRFRKTKSSYELATDTSLLNYLLERNRNINDEIARFQATQESVLNQIQKNLETLKALSNS